MPAAVYAVVALTLVGTAAPAFAGTHPLYRTSQKALDDGDAARAYADARAAAWLSGTDRHRKYDGQVSLAESELPAWLLEQSVLAEAEGDVERAWWHAMDARSWADRVKPPWYLEDAPTPDWHGRLDRVAALKPALDERLASLAAPLFAQIEARRETEPLVALWRGRAMVSAWTAPEAAPYAAKVKAWEEGHHMRPIPEHVPAAEMASHVDAPLIAVATGTPCDELARRWADTVGHSPGSAHVLTLTTCEEDAHIGTGEVHTVVWERHGALVAERMAHTTDDDLYLVTDVPVTYSSTVEVASAHLHLEGTLRFVSDDFAFEKPVRFVGERTEPLNGGDGESWKTAIMEGLWRDAHRSLWLAGRDMVASYAAYRQGREARAAEAALPVDETLPIRYLERRLLRAERAGAWELLVALSRELDVPMAAVAAYRRGETPEIRPVPPIALDARPTLDPRDDPPSRWGPPSRVAAEHVAACEAGEALGCADAIEAFDEAGLGGQADDLRVVDCLRSDVQAACFARSPGYRPDNLWARPWEIVLVPGYD